MPQIGLCTDITCDRDIKQLYECHCCNRFICLNHLIEHVEIRKQNKERLNSLTNELLTITNTLKLIVEKKLVEIEYDQKLIDQAKQLLDVPICSVDEIQNIFDLINQAITSNRSEEAIVKVESSLSDDRNSSCICKYDNEQISSNDQSSLDHFQSETASPVCLDLTCDTDESQKSAMTIENEYSMYADHGFINNILLDQTVDPTKDEAEDEDNDEENEIPQTAGTKTATGLCPLTFDGAFGLTEGKHAIRLCSDDKHRKKIGLYRHFTGKHQLKSGCARRLLQAVTNGDGPMTTLLFNSNEDVINHFYKIPCPFQNGMIYLFGCNHKNIIRVPCRLKAVIFPTLKFHLKTYHHVPEHVAQKLYNHYKEIRTQNNDNSH